MPVPSEREERFAPASPIRLGQPQLGARAGLRAARLVVAFNWRVGKDAAKAAWDWFLDGGWHSAAFVSIVSTLVAGVGERGVHVVHLILAGIAGVGALLILVFLGHFFIGPLRLVEEERRRLRREVRSLDTADPEPPGRDVQLPFPDSPYSIETPGREPVILRPLPDDETKSH